MIGAGNATHIPLGPYTGAPGGAPLGAPRPFPHPPVVPAVPRVPLAPLGPVGGAVVRAGSRFPVGAAVVAAGVGLWFLWSWLNPPAVPPLPNPNTGNVLVEVVVRYQQCADQQLQFCNDWNGPIVERVEDVWGFGNGVRFATWVKRRDPGSGGFWVANRAWRPDGSVDGGELLVGVRPPQTPMLRPHSVYFKKTFDPGVQDPNPSPHWEDPWPQADPFAPRPPSGPKPHFPPPPAPAADPGLKPPAAPLSDPRWPKLDPSPIRSPGGDPGPAREPGGEPGGDPDPARSPDPSGPPPPQPQPPPDTSRPPIPRPQPKPPIWPAQDPDPLGDDGRPRPKPDPKPEQIDPQVHIVNNYLVGGPGVAVRPNLVSIGQELGRLESKLGHALRLLDPDDVPQDRTDEVLARIKALSDAVVQPVVDGIPESLSNLQDSVDGLANMPERELGPLAVTSQAPADFNVDGSRASFTIDIPRLPATEFETLFLQRLLELLHWQKTCRNHVAKKGTDGDPVTITWREVPSSQ